LNSIKADFRICRGHTLLLLRSTNPAQIAKSKQRTECKQECYDGCAPHAGPLMDERIVNAINAELASKGGRSCQKARTSEWRLTSQRRKGTLETFYSGFGGAWPWHYWGGGRE
jgi:hypothetical protein